MKFTDILKKFRTESFSERHKGDKFEKLIKAYFQTDPKYASQIEKIWLWNEFPYKKDFGGKDIGIDLVAKSSLGEYWAIQCKCYDEHAPMDKKAVDSFLATSGKTFVDDSLERQEFKQRYWVSTSYEWTNNATEVFLNQKIPVNRISQTDLINSPVNWAEIYKGKAGKDSRLIKKTPKPHQIEAISESYNYFKKRDRGQLIMACGTGKTFTSLKIAEKETPPNGLVLFLVPSIALLGQTLNEWFADSERKINPILICSDPKINRKKQDAYDEDSFSTIDLALPATTDSKRIAQQLEQFSSGKKNEMTVVFSTYQSIDVISKAQKKLLKETGGDYGTFDIVICDEAHRTTGVELSKEEKSHFIKVHEEKYINAKKRLYMTATPRLYSPNDKSKAAKEEIPLCSMDDVKIYGDVIYRIGFGRAVEEGLLTDYKVLILTLDEHDVPLSVQNALQKEDLQIQMDATSKLIGCINALSKKIVGEENPIAAFDPGPMKKAVAFCQTIKNSEEITKAFNSLNENYFDAISTSHKNELNDVSSKHIDGTMSAPKRDELLSWLKEESEESRILTNVKCLSEGIDVPSLDAIFFLAARNSEVDVVQSVGRVMRLSPKTNKKYGYIVIPIFVPSEIEPEKALDNNTNYRVVWSVLNALRAHDDRFEATINKIDLNKNKPSKISVGGVPKDKEDEEGSTKKTTESEIQQQMSLKLNELKGIVYAKIVKKVGERQYWEKWARDVAAIAENQKARIKKLIKENPQHNKAFEKFVNGLQKNINPSITSEESIDMLSQHIITKPVFEALFEGYSFVKNNPVSKSMQKMLDLLEKASIETEAKELEKFYSQVRKRAENIDNAEGKQKIIIELYDKFFKTAFPKLVEKLGIVYTPIEVVDFIVHSVCDILKSEFNRDISDENIHLLDPFTGTGTFITRLIQSGRINKKDLIRKYEKEIHANEIVLLAYYIAAVNIENAYHDVLGAEDYKPFEGICLTDTFQLGETEEGEDLLSEMFPQNSARVKAQKKAPLRIIFGNPPYSVGQGSANDNAQNQKYPYLDFKIAETYAKQSNATNKNSLYDSYIKAFRWSTDRLDPKNGGIIGFVSNGAWLDGNSQDGFRKSLEEEFSKIWVFNLRGNQRTSGELSRKEGGKIFGSGSRTPISITLLVKNPNSNNKKAEIKYLDIGDYLSREQKLSIISEKASIKNSAIKWNTLNPNEHGDWINKGSNNFLAYPGIGDKQNSRDSSIFNSIYSRGLATARDAYCYSFSEIRLKNIISEFINYYNQERTKFQEQKARKNVLDLKEFIDFNTKKVTWNRGLLNDFQKNKAIKFSIENIRKSIYRPFVKSNVYFAAELNDMVYQLPKLFPTSTSKNIVICVSGVGASKDFSCLISDMIPDLQVQFNGQCFPLYYYEKNNEKNQDLFSDGEEEYIRRDSISDFIHQKAKSLYGSKVTKEDIFYYVYGFLHSKEYRETFANDLKKSLPRLPLIDEINDFWAFSKAGRKLADLHINYENVPPPKGLVIKGKHSGNFKVTKMKFEAKNKKDIIHYNNEIMIANIPEKAYEYVVNGKSAIEWIMERYQITTHKDSGIINDPNDWAKEHDKPSYIYDLLLSVINLSVQSVDIVNTLPTIKFD